MKASEQYRNRQIYDELYQYLIENVEPKDPTTDPAEDCLLSIHAICFPSGNLPTHFTDVTAKLKKGFVDGYAMNCRDPELRTYVDWDYIIVQIYDEYKHKPSTGITLIVGILTELACDESNMEQITDIHDILEAVYKYYKIAQ